MKPCSYMLMAAGLLLAAGCVQIDHELVLNRDGSGSVRLTYAVHEDEGGMAEQAGRELLRQMLAVSGGARLPQDMSDSEIRAQFATYAKYGVQLDRLTTERVPGRVIRRSTISFKTLAGLARALLPERTVALTRDARDNYLLSQQPGGGDSVANRLAAAMADDPNPLFTGVFQGFLATVKITTPGRVLESNATQTSQSSAVWRFEFDKDPQAICHALQRPMRLTFDGRGLTLKPFVHKAGEP